MYKLCILFEFNVLFSCKGQESSKFMKNFDGAITLALKQPHPSETQRSFEIASG